MFTGIIEEQGILQGLTRMKNLVVLRIKARRVLSGTKIGDSIAVNGVCLTVTGKSKQGLSFDVMKETLDVTTLRNLKLKQKVNLERALKANDRVGGHFVTGHVDEVGAIRKIIRDAQYIEFQVNCPDHLKRYIVPKGSVTLDGVSLTVGKVSGRFFSVYLIPHTLQVTNLSTKRVGSGVNIETDLLAKYILQQ